ncbi:MAG TPA: tetratricopeptide repeat protein [Kofleriaceae bacterium]|nr:tetratricopeptide repeat protein [Kofleriaceae bacterium]
MRRVLALGLLVACSAPGPIPELGEAERLEKSGDREGALRSYRAAQDSCQRIEDLRRRRAACSEAHLGRAELLVDLDRREEAARAFEETAAALGADDPASAARATLRAGQLRLDLGQDEPAYALLWRVVTDWPDEAFAGDALVVLLRDGRARDAAQLYDVLAQLHGRIGSSQLGDNLLYAMADLAERERSDLALARSHLDRIPVDHPKSGLRDDSWWHAARISRALGDPEGAAVRLRALLATREVAWGAGSYFSVWLDDAQLELGRVLRDELHRPAEAIDAFARLPRDYPASVLKDDALWERAVTLEATGDTAAACAALAELATRYPDSKWELGEAPARRQRLGCKPAASAGPR